MTSEVVAWSISSEKGAEFISDEPGKDSSPYVSQWKLDDLISLLNVTLNSDDIPTEEDLWKEFSSSANVSSLSESEKKAAFEYFKAGANTQNSALIYAKQKIKTLEAIFEQRMSIEAWRKVEEVCWRIFSDGGKSYRGCTKERLEELYKFIVEGNEHAIQ